MKPTALVTGATAGFGEAIALQLAGEGYRIIANGRRVDRLNKLCERIHQLGGEAIACPFDVRDKSEVVQAIDGLPAGWDTLEVLVNNAGLALGRAHIAQGDPADWDAMIDTNVKGLLYVTRAVIPRMRNAMNPIIVNLGSIAGKEVYPGGNVYCASKFAVDALTKALRAELLEWGIRVSQIAPGAAETEFSQVRYKGDAQKAKSVYEGYIPLSAEDIAKTVSFIVNVPAHVCINDLVIVPKAQANSFMINRK